MRKLAELCIQRPVFASMIILALVVVGAASYFRLGVDRFPSVDLPTVSVRTTLRGASPEETETEITDVIEQAVNQVDGIDELRSITGPGNSIVIATFRLDRDIDSAAQDVRDKVSAIIRRLPEDVDPPVVSKFDNDSRPVVTIALSGERSVRELTELADKVVKVQLERAKGVGAVNLVGGAGRTINVWVDAEKLAAYQIPITAVRDAVAQQNAEVPGGNLTGADRESQLRTMGRIADPRAFNDIVITRVNGAPVRVRDVGRVEDGSGERRSSARLNGRAAVTLEVRRQSGANTVEVIEGVKRNMEQARAQLPAGVEMEVISDQSRYIYNALHEINSHLILGSIFACLVVLAFMRSWRGVVIAGIAIPASLISTFAMMRALDFTLNSVTMLALVLMVGIVIDDAIVVLENIFRFVEEKRMTPFEAARRGTAEIALAVLATTLSLVVIFIPVSFMSSISGRFLYQFGITAAVAVLVSLLVSFTLTPTLSARMLKRATGPADHDHARSRRGFYGVIDRAYTAMLRTVMRWRYLTAALGIAVVLTSIPLYRAVRQDYLPSDVDEAEFQMSVSAPEGTAFAAMDDAMRAVESDVLAMPEVRTVLATSGGGFMGQTNSGSLYVRIAPHEERYFSLGRLWHATLEGHPMSAFRGGYTQRDVMMKIRAKMREYRDLRIAVRNLPSFNIGGGSFDLDFVIKGPELESLARYAEELRAMTRDGRIEGILDADTTLKLDKPELRVIIDRERAADLGISPRDIGTALRVMVGGETDITEYRDPQTNENYNVALRLSERDRTDATQIPRLLLPRQGGSRDSAASSDPRRLIELRSIATLDTATSAARIDRLDRRRSANLRAGVAPGYALADRIEAVRAAADGLNMPPAYTTAVSGRGRELERTFGEFIWAFGLSIIFMYMILASNYESLIHPLTILLALPLSIPFALLSLYLTGGTLNLYSALGMLVLFGVVKKNSILQIDHMNQLRAAGMKRYDAIIEGNRDRLRPILMTTLSLIAGMLPLALGAGPGAEERRAVAVVVIGGQLLSLGLTLLITPVAYSLFDDLGARIARRGKKAGEPASIDDDASAALAVPQSVQA